MKKKVVVNDIMQDGYVYWLTEPVGRHFAPEFTPDLTPPEMLGRVSSSSCVTVCCPTITRSRARRATPGCP